MTENDEVPAADDNGDREATTNVLASTPKIAAALAEKYPALFAKRVPLAIGIHAALAAALPEFTPEQISAFLAEWVADLRYLAKIRAGKSRVDLKGQPTGTITEQEESFAKLRAQEIQRRKI